MKKNIGFMLGVYVLFVFACSKSDSTKKQPVNPPVSSDSTFTNPLLTSGPDPWVAQKDGYYYYMCTLDNKISLWKTKAMSDLKNATIKTVWTPTIGTGYSNNIWAPEMHNIDGKWYIYFTADSNGIDETHRLFVIENDASDPTAGTWTFKGKIAALSDIWAIDATEFDYKGSSYLAWSGWKGGEHYGHLYIGRLSDPWTLENSGVLISSPTYSWEQNGFPVNEGPEALINPAGNLFLIYSASFCGTDDYCLGQLALKPGGDPLNPADWSKSTQPVFTKNVNGGAFGPGHNGFFKSPDGKEDWIIYHANNFAGQGCGDVRNPRIQKFTWNSDGTPNFGTPVSISKKIVKPSGE